MLAFALLAGVAAVVLAGRWLTQQTTTVIKQVIVANRDVGLGQALNQNLLQTIPWSASTLPDGAFTDPKQLEGRVVITTIQRGEPILASRLAPIGTKGGLSAVIPTGRRALTVRVNEVVGVAGFALPGNYVDVLINTQDEQKKQISKIVLEHILVLAVAQEAGRDDTRPKVVNAVTLELTPEQAERLDLARSIGTLSLVLRNQIDENPTLTGGATRENLLGIKQAATPPPPPPPAQVAVAPASRRVVQSRPAKPKQETVEVIRGVQRSIARF
jgi:pilus assembly protein CpaB